jgi:hypothetical protein
MHEKVALTSPWYPSGEIQQHIVTLKFQHFKPTNKFPAVLVLDEHYSEFKNLYIIDMVSESHVSLVCLPPHSVHRNQPLGGFYEAI